MTPRSIISTILTVGITVLTVFIIFWGLESCIKREAKNHKAYIASLPEGKTYTVRVGDVIFLPDGTEIRFIGFDSTSPRFLVGSYLYFPKGKLKSGEDLRYFGDLPIDLRGELFGAPIIKLPFTLHILSADRSLIIYRLSRNM